MNFFLTINRKIKVMNGIIVRDNEPFEKALRRFTKVCDTAGVLSDLKNYKFFEKPSAERKRKLNIAKRRRAKDEQKFEKRRGRY
jgi:small subunit ribosomal protein S21